MDTLIKVIDSLTSGLSVLNELQHNFHLCVWKLYKESPETELHFLQDNLF